MHPQQPPRVCVCELTPAAGTGEAEPAGTGEAWRWDELSHRGLDRNGLCRRPEPGHREPPHNAPHKRMEMTENSPQLSKGGVVIETQRTARPAGSQVENKQNC